MQNTFPSNYEAILERIENINPGAYARSRNFADGAVTRLGPYISRGVISTRLVMERLMAKGHTVKNAEKMFQELAWRDYWQQVWIAKGDAIFSDLKRPQPGAEQTGIPRAVVEARTGIEAVDRAIEELYATGYMHNHMRMYVASIVCNIARCHWRTGAEWMYAHLLDGDLASNHLSWQWVAGSNANKKYYANQENINKYFGSNQRDTFLDVPYEQFDSLDIPPVLRDTQSFELETQLPASDQPTLENKKTLIYNYYNLDPLWHVDQQVQRVLLLEPSVFSKHPVGVRAMEFMLELRQNIDGLQVFVGEFEDLLEQLDADNIIYKEHPLNQHYDGTEASRDWMSPVSGYYSSFFGFWKKCKMAKTG